MATLVTRSGKGSPLTHAEVDANFTNLNTDKLELSGGTMTGNLSFGDNDKAIFGAGSDLQIYHSGAGSFISEAGTGNLFIEGSSEINFRNTAQTAYLMRLIDGGNVRLYHAGSQKLATTSTGIDVTGTVTADGLTVDGTSALNDNVTITQSATPTLTFTSYPSTQDTVATIYSGRAEFSGTNSFLRFGTNDGTSTKLRMDINQGGDISFYEDTGTTAKFFWDASAESLGIGTTSPATPLDVTKAGGGNFIATFQNTTSATPYGVWIKEPSSATSGYPSFQITDNAGTAARLRVDSGTGNVGIGTSSPSAKLDIAETDSVTYSSSAVQGDLIISRKNSANTVNQVVGLEFDVTGWSGSTTGVAGISAIQTGSNASSAALAFQTRNAGTIGERMRIDSSGNVGIGTSSPTAKVTVSGTGVGAAVDWTNTTASTGRSYRWVSLNNGTGFAIEDLTSGTERMRIDSSGNLLVGVTSANGNVAGQEFRTGGATYITRDGNTPLVTNRKTSDGAIQEFRKDGTTVGSIGTESGSGFDAMYIANGDAGLIFQGYANDAIIPFDGSTLDKRDAAIDLGYASGRFKDLYLSGGVYLGGTGAANKLDDYEEGTFTPSGFTSWTVSPTFTAATYTKIGRQVTLFIHFATGTTGNQAYFSGAPFTGNGVGAGSNGSISDMGHVFVSGSNVWFTKDNTSVSGARFTVTYIV